MEDDDNEFIKNNENKEDEGPVKSKVSPINNNVVYPSERKGSVGSDLIRYTNPFVNLNNSPYLGGGSFAGDKFTAIKTDQNAFNPSGGYLNYKRNNFGNNNNNNYVDKKNALNLNPISTNINNLSSLTSKNYDMLNQLTVLSTESLSSHSDMVCSDSPFFDSDYSNLQTTKLLSNSKENLKDMYDGNEIEGNKRKTSNYDRLKIDALLSSPSNTNTTENETTTNSTIDTDTGNEIQETTGSDSQIDLNTSKVVLNELDKRKIKTKSRHYSFTSRKSNISMNSPYGDPSNQSILHRTFKGIRKVFRFCFCCQCCISDNASYYGSTMIKVNEGNSKKKNKDDQKELIECEVLEDGLYDNKGYIDSYERLNEPADYISISPNKKYPKKSKKMNSGNGFVFTKKKNYRFKLFKKRNSKKISSPQQKISSPQQPMTLSKLNPSPLYDDNSNITTLSTNTSTIIDNGKDNNTDTIMDTPVSDVTDPSKSPTKLPLSSSNGQIPPSMGQNSTFSKRISNMFSTSPFKGLALTDEEKLTKQQLKEKKKEEKRKRLIEKEMKEVERKYLKEEKRKEKKKKGKYIKAFHNKGKENEEKLKLRMERRRASVVSDTIPKEEEADNGMKSTELLIFNNVMRVFNKTIHEMIPKELSNKYLFTGLLGWGGNGYVAAAVLRETGMPVSIKFITRRCVDKSSLVYNTRFKDGYPYEANIMENIDHPNIEKIYDIFDDDEYFYLVLERIGNNIDENRQLKKNYILPYLSRKVTDVTEGTEEFNSSMVTTLHNPTTEGYTIKTNNDSSTKYYTEESKLDPTTTSLTELKDKSKNKNELPYNNTILNNVEIINTIIPEDKSYDHQDLYTTSKKNDLSDLIRYKKPQKEHKVNKMKSTDLLLDDDSTTDSFSFNQAERNDSEFSSPIDESSQSSTTMTSVINCNENDPGFNFKFYYINIFKTIASKDYKGIQPPFEKLTKPANNHTSDLSNFITENKGQITYAMKKSILRQLAEAHKVLHDKKINYLDYKPENILIEYKSKDEYQLKLIDFGMAHKWLSDSYPALDHLMKKLNHEDDNISIEEDMEKDVFVQYGTKEASAPEILLDNCYNGPEADIWALGLIFYYVCTEGKKPFSTLKDIVTSEVKFPDFINNNDMYSDMKNLIQKMLNKNYKRRITIYEVCEHPFFTSTTY